MSWIVKWFLNNIIACANTFLITQSWLGQTLKWTLKQLIVCFLFGEDLVVRHLVINTVMAIKLLVKFKVVIYGSCLVQRRRLSCARSLSWL